MADIEIDSGDVLRVVMQFLQEQGLSKSLHQLQDETGVALNTVEDVDAFNSEILSGSWDKVLPRISTLKLPEAVVQALYEQIACELIESRELEAARALLRASLPLILLKQEKPARYSRLESLLTRGAYDVTAADIYPEGSKERGRQDIGRRILEHTSTAPPSRLIILLGQALKWQQHTGQLAPGQAYDLFRVAQALRRPDSEKPCVAYSGSNIKFGAAARPTAVVYTPDASCLISGSIDGIIEVYDPVSLKPKLDLPFQAKDEFMLHDDAVLALAVSRDSELLASGGKDGKLKVWRIKTGECLRKFGQAHADAPVSCCVFSRDASQVLSGGGDGVARVFGLRSGKCLKEFRGHTAAITSVCWLEDGVTAVTGSADGQVRTWDTRTGEGVCIIRPPQEVLTADSPVLAVIPVPRTVDQLLVVQRAGTVHCMSTNGGVVRAYTHARKPAPGSQDLHANSVKIAGSTRETGAAARTGVGAIGADFICACVSPLGKYLYAGSEDGMIYCWAVTTGVLEAASTHPLHEVPLSGAAGGTKGALLTGLVHHPHTNSVASYAEDGLLKVWKA